MWGQQEQGTEADQTLILLEVTHVNSTHISLAKASYRATPNVKGEEESSPTMCGEGEP